MLYKVKVSEIATRYVFIQAEDGGEAEEKAIALWNDESITVDYRDFDGVEAEWVEEYEDDCAAAAIEEGYEVFQ